MIFLVRKNIQSTRWVGGEFTPTGEIGGVEVGKLQIGNERITVTRAEGERRINIANELNRKWEETFNLPADERKAARESIMKERNVTTNIFKNIDVYRDKRNTYLAKLDSFVDGSKITGTAGYAGSLKNYSNADPEIESLLRQVVEQIDAMSEAERIEFYENNADLFTDMSDYYKRIKKASGRLSDESAPSVREVKKNLKDIVERANRVTGLYV